MNKIEKLLRKISEKDRKKLVDLISEISQNNKSLKIIKIKNTDFFRIRCGNFRIIFHKEKEEIIIDSIKLRNKNTYKDL
jgi:mRNA-degrading endonuclease RelE of RelBE toxin-antitoxin system